MDTSSYGLLEVRIFKGRDERNVKYIKHGQVKYGTEISHGRSVTIWYNGKF